MIKEFNEDRAYNDLKKKTKKVAAREKKIVINDYLNTVMKRPENNALMPRLRVVRDIEDAQRRRRQIESKY